VWLKRFDDHLSRSSSGFIVGNTLTIVDLRLRTMVDSFLTGNVDYIAKEYIEQFQQLIWHWQLVGVQPKVLEYYTKQQEQQ
jgi:hypothetical protein